MRFLIDKHHSDLAYSLQLVLEKRLGHEIFFPIGMDWYEEGYWNVYPHIDTAKQYLLDGFIPKDGTQPLTQISKLENGIHIMKDIHNESEHKAITLAQFKEMEFDVVIASIPQHVKPFRELIGKYSGKAKLIFQMGNMFNEVNDVLKETQNLMASTLPFRNSVNAVFYHQEFDTEIFRPSDIKPERQITSFINVLHDNPGAIDFIELVAGLPDFDFKSYGGQNADGVKNTTVEIADTMQRSFFGFHSKRGGDGYGHILYNWFACGRPIITRLSDYKGKLGEELMVDDETILDLDKYDYDGICLKLSNLAPHEYQYMCQQVRNKFLERVDFEADSVKISKFLENLR